MYQQSLKAIKLKFLKNTLILMCPKTDVKNFQYHDNYGNIIMKIILFIEKIKNRDPFISFLIQ